MPVILLTTGKMAGNHATQPAQPWIKSDEIRLDTSKAPWMGFAKAELGKKIHEMKADDSFIDSMRQALTLDERTRSMDRRIEEFGKDSKLLGRSPSPFDIDNDFMSRKLHNPATGLLGIMEADRLRERNPEIDKYFDDLRTDPAYDRKSRSFDIAPTYSRDDRGQITAWCAAFVNWCLIQAAAPHLGYATARSWLDFGTPVAHPIYGCITVIKPSSSTGSTTGHVAFYVETRGNNVHLLGGNQGDAVSVSAFRESKVLGYRWPTRINHYLLAGTGVQV
jgi:uncharacterized protein (TIGR02594 family)